MARVTWNEVNLILEADQPEAVLDEFITPANEFITEVFGSDTTISDELKKQLEKFYAAHLVTATLARQYIEAGGGPAPKIRYVGAYGIGMDSTSYGQQVLAMDPTGKIMAVAGKNRARIRAVPQFPS